MRDSTASFDLELLRDLARRSVGARSARQACELAVGTIARSLDVPFALVYLDGELQAETPGATTRRATMPPELAKELSFPGGTIVLGIDPKRLFDDQYVAFVDLVALQIATTIGNARSSEQMASLRGEVESANRAKDEFLAMLGHELRNPLAPISTAIQLMRLRGAPVPELGTLERQTAHLTRLVDDLLDVSRITRGKIELHKRTVEIGDALVRAMEMAGPLLEQRAHRVSIEAVPRRGLAVHADPERLAQVMFNLLSNAAKYSEARSSITVRAWRDTDRVRLSVRDEGVGIAPEMIDRVFDMFVQQEQTLERSQGGLGLGLAIVRSLVELHDGRVTAKSPGPGRGSEFMIDLPAAPVVLPLAPAGERALRPDTGPAQRFLVVDDNVDAATALAELLRLLGHQVEVAHDGLRALSAALRFRPDIALIDIGLPVMDGHELAVRLREEHPELRLVAVTGYGGERDRERSARAGFTDHLVKPIELAMLEQLLVPGGIIPGARPQSGTGQPAL